MAFHAVSKSQLICDVFVEGMVLVDKKNQNCLL